MTLQNDMLITQVADIQRTSYKSKKQVYDARIVNITLPTPANELCISRNIILI